MKKTISHALWAFTLASFTVSACGKNDPAKTASNENTGAHIQAQPTTESEELVKAGPEGTTRNDSVETADEAMAMDGEAPAMPASTEMAKPSKAYAAKPKVAIGGMSAPRPMPMSPPPPPKDRDIGQGSEDYKDYGKNPMVSS